MATATPRPLFIVAGAGNPKGSGAAAARLFAKEGCSIALIGRDASSIKLLADQINASGGTAHAFISAYTPAALSQTFTTLRAHFHTSYPTPKHTLRCALFAVAPPPGAGTQPFLTVNSKQYDETIVGVLGAAWAFTRECLYMCREGDGEEGVDEGERERMGKGTVIIAGDSGSLSGRQEGGVESSGGAVAKAAKTAARALSACLRDEFSDVHSAHVIIDEANTPSNPRSSHASWELSHAPGLTPEGIAQSYLYLANQAKTEWTWELDLRPSRSNL